MNTTTRTIVLVIVVLAIGGIIYFLEKQNAHPVQSAASASDVAANQEVPATSTASNASSASSTSGTHAFVLSQDPNYVANKSKYPAAKELVSPDAYINTAGQPIKLVNYIGKDVVLLDFWTYSCINCQRTIPYLEAWYKKYQNYGLVVIGVHTPEFAFEKILSNVQAGVTKFGITYPVVLDSEYQTWDAYGNQYWPEEYLVDIDGLVREHNIGEGNYAETEQNIQKLLKERAVTLGIATTIPTGQVTENETINTNSPETYFDWSRNHLGNGKASTPGVQAFTTPATINPNLAYLGGTWNIGGESAVNTTDGATITYKYDAQNVYMVASANPGVTITVTRDGQPLGSFAGADANAAGTVTIGAARLYTLIHEPSEGVHTIQITVHGTGFNAFTFTFG